MNLSLITRHLTPLIITNTVKQSGVNVNVFIKITSMKQLTIWLEMRHAALSRSVCVTDMQRIVGTRVHRQRQITRQSIDYHQESLLWNLKSHQHPIYQIKGGN